MAIGGWGSLVMRQRDWPPNFEKQLVIRRGVAHWNLEDGGDRKYFNYFPLNDS